MPKIEALVAASTSPSVALAASWRLTPRMAAYAHLNSLSQAVFSILLYSFSPLLHNIYVYATFLCPLPCMSLPFIDRTLRLALFYLLSAAFITNTWKDTSLWRSFGPLPTIGRVLIAFLTLDRWPQITSAHHATAIHEPHTHHQTRMFCQDCAVILRFDWIKFSRLIDFLLAQRQRSYWLWQSIGTNKKLRRVDVTRAYKAKTRLPAATPKNCHV